MKFQFVYIEKDIGRGVRHIVYVKDRVTGNVLCSFFGESREMAEENAHQAALWVQSSCKFSSEGFAAKVKEILDSGE